MPSEDEEFVPLGDMMNLTFQIVAEIIKSNPDLVFASDSHERMLLHHAAETRRTDVVELLVQLQADVNARDNVGRTPLHWAANRIRAKFIYRTEGVQWACFSALRTKYPVGYFGATP